MAKVQPRASAGKAHARVAPRAPDHPVPRASPILLAPPRMGICQRSLSLAA